MSHKLWTLSLPFVCLLGISVPLWGQDVGAEHGIRGYVDPRTRIFHPLPQAQDADVKPAAATSVTGKFVFNFTITVDSTIASTNQITCFAGASVNDTVAPNNVLEAAAVTVPRGSGSTVTCTVTIPYSWKLGSASTDTVSLSYSVISPTSIGILLNSMSAYPQRLGSQKIGTIKVPANGATTTETITATM